MRLILASSSPRRKEILKELGIDFEIVVPDVDELETLHDPQKLSSINANMKCNKIVKKYPKEFVLSADTVVELNGEIFSKPRDIEDATNMLLKLSGHTHNVCTTIVLRNVEQNIYEEHISASEVSFKTLTRDMIIEYFKKVNPLDKCGAYAIQQSENILAQSPRGDITNIVGLPKILTYNMLKKFGF